MIAEIGTPCGSSALGERAGLFRIGAVNRLFGCAALSPDAFIQGRPCQSSIPSTGSRSMPSHQTSPSGVIATLVKIVSCSTISIAFGFELTLVPGATPKYPASGLTAQSVPSGATRIQAMSSPTVKTRHPPSDSGGRSIAKFVFPQALGNAAATYV